MSGNWGAALLCIAALTVGCLALTEQFGALLPAVAAFGAAWAICTREARPS